MTEQTQLIPLPPVVRERLARSVREARLLRSLLRLSIKANEELSRPVPHNARPTSPESKGGGQ